nr:TrkA C-terminal domain-containing protein [Saliphagus sp. LR7]
MSLVMAGRCPEEAEALAPVFGIVGAAEKTSDATGDIAKVILEEMELPPTLRETLPDAIKTLARVTVSTDSLYAGRTLGDINLETEKGVRVLALRRDDQWLLNPTRETALQASDVLFCRGTEQGLARVYETVTGDPYATQSLEDLDRAVETVALMKNMSELTVDLAYGSVLLGNPELAEEVHELEVDALQSRFEIWALRAAKAIDDPVSIRRLLHIATSTKDISDSALEISEGVLRGVGSHPVVEAAVRESNEIIDRTTVASRSRLDGTTISDAEVKTRTGMHIVAIRQKSVESNDRTKYYISPLPDTTLRADDMLITKGRHAGADRLSDWAA